MSAADFFNGIIADHAAAQLAAAPKADTHRTWEIALNFLGQWVAVSPNYDAHTDDFGEWEDNGEIVHALTREALIAEIDAWFEARGQ